MTTRPTVVRASDVLRPNEVVYVSNDPRLAGVGIGAVAWSFTDGSPSDRHVEGMKLAAAFATDVIPNGSSWLLAAHTAWQPNNRITQHRGLWKSLGARNLEIPVGQRLPESFMESAEGRRYFGGVQLQTSETALAVAIMEHEPASHVVILKREMESMVKLLVRSGWTLPAFGPSPEITSEVCAAGGMVLRLHGAFDDREMGAMVIAKTHLLPEVSSETLIAAKD